ncbi:hypothetical protein OAP18_02165 [Gammaproteobacteria bacterium]|nr:hypothetical protein [Gammaproteobacteria bacterium]
MKKFNSTAILSSFSLALLTSCASPYQITDNSRTILQSLDSESAPTMLLSHLRKTDTGGGFCIGGLSMRSGYKTHEQLTLDNDGTLHFIADYISGSHYTGATLISGPVRTPVIEYDWDAGEFAFDLTDITSIRVKNTSGSFYDTFCQEYVQGKLVMALGEDDLSFYINVQEADLDEVIASLTFFADDAKLKEGLGF